MSHYISTQTQEDFMCEPTPFNYSNIQTSPKSPCLLEKQLYSIDFLYERLGVQAARKHSGTNLH